MFIFRNVQNPPKKKKTRTRKPTRLISGGHDVEDDGKKKEPIHLMPFWFLYLDQNIMIKINNKMNRFKFEFFLFEWCDPFFMVCFYCPRKEIRKTKNVVFIQICLNYHARDQNHNRAMNEVTS